MTIKFETNVPQVVTLRYLDGREVNSQFGGIQRMFSADEGTFYVSDMVGGIIVEQLAALGVRQGEPVEICKREVATGRGRKSIRWEVARPGMVVGELPVTPAEESELTRQLQASIAAAQAAKVEAKPAQRETRQAQVAAAVPVWTDGLVAQTTALVDAYAAAIRHASKYEGLVKPEDVRSIFLSVVINDSKQKGRAA